jgi:hypothetical protein
MANFRTPHEPKNIEEGPNKSESEKNSLFGGTPIEQDEPELSASFYAEQNPAEQAQPHPYQSFVFKDYQSPVTFDKPHQTYHDEHPNGANTGCSQQSKRIWHEQTDAIHWRLNEDQAIPSRLPGVPGYEPEYLQHRPTEDRIHPILYE